MSEEKVTSLELSEKLKEAGAKQNAEKAWVEVGDGVNPPYLIELVADNHPGNPVSAFDCHELLEDLIPIGDVSLTVTANGRYIAKKEIDKDSGQLYISYSPAQALGELRLWALENGHCEK